MEKLKMHSPNIAEENIDKLSAIFPGCITESADDKGNIIRAIDFDLLRQELSTSIVEGPQERYHLNWPGKREALLTANAPIAKTLRPCREESVAFDTTENLFIEGDNLDALKLLQETYLGKVKIIYIDPPYNTGNDFIYDDDFAESTDEFLTRSNQKDEDGNRLVANTEANGRFHSDWLSMMYSRLKLARNLLKDDGVIFVSIGDNEVHNLRKICDEIFGKNNFITTFSRMMKSGGAKGRFITPTIDFILSYAKDILATPPFRQPFTKDQIDRFYIKTETLGRRTGEKYGEDRIYKASLSHRPNQRYYIECPDGSFVIPPGINFPKKVTHGEKITPTYEDKVWKWTFDRYSDELKKGNIVFKQTKTSALVDQNGNKSIWNLYNKLWLKDQEDKGVVPSTYIGRFENRQSAAELKSLKIPFDFAKPTALIKYLIVMSKTVEDDVIVDFFAGSSTTAHAVMQLNAEDGSKRKFIMVQLPELCDQNSEAFKAGYKSIAEISKERIRRAGKKIIESECHENWNKDIGFRVLKIDSSNMADIFYTPDAIVQKELFQSTDNIRDDRTSEDLLFQVLLDWGVDLTLPIKKETIEGHEVFFVDGNALAACFNKNGEITEDFCKKLAERKPLRVVFRDAGFNNDSAKINVEQIFKLISPQTDVKTI